jgi:hypothetical protein
VESTQTLIVLKLAGNTPMSTARFPGDTIFLPEGMRLWQCQRETGPLAQVSITNGEAGSSHHIGRFQRANGGFWHH